MHLGWRKKTPQCILAYISFPRSYMQSSPTLRYHTILKQYWITNGLTITEAINYSRRSARDGRGQYWI